MESITFRRATTDDYRFIAHGFHMAMLMADTPESDIDSFAELICKRDDVLYCAHNTIIAEYDGQRAGMLTAYDGRLYSAMQRRTFALLKEHRGIEFPGMEDEACEGEYYLDSLAVWPEFRGRGIGRALLQRGIADGESMGLTVTLAVDPVNTRAQKLYHTLGFERQTDLFIFGHTYWKMAHL